MKLSTSVIKRPKVETKAFTFTDPANADCSFTLDLRKLTAMEQVAAADAARDYAVKYVQGLGEKDTDGYTPPEPFPPIDGQPVYLSDSVCQVAAFAEYAQTAHDDNRYTFEELVAFMTLNAIANALATAAVWVQTPSGVTDDPKATSGE